MWYKLFLNNWEQFAKWADFPWIRASSFTQGINFSYFTCHCDTVLFDTHRCAHESPFESQISKYSLVGVINPRVDIYRNFILLSLSSTHDVLIGQKTLGPNNEYVSTVKFSHHIRLENKSQTTLLILLSGDVQIQPGPTEYSCISDVDDSHFQCFQRKGMHFVHLNARSLLPKMSELRLFCS